MEIDWSATAAWIALIVSIVGTITSPLITTLLTNRHQFKMRKLEMETIAKTKYIDERNAVFNIFVAKTGQVLISADDVSLKEFGEAFFKVYQYIPSKQWGYLDLFYKAVTNRQTHAISEMYPDIIYLLAETAKELPPEIHKKQSE